MDKESAPCQGLEWRISLPDGMTTKIFVSECWPNGRLSTRVDMGLSLKYWGLIRKGCRYGMREPKWIIHSFKVGVALCVASLFYYFNPLYEGLGGNAMWAILSVVVGFEYTVGATICKCLNRAAATLIAGSLGIGVHLVASRFGATVELLILQASVFVIAAAATFPRFMPSVKAHFDHGALIFIFTFVLVSVSGYREAELVALAHHRLSTVAIGVSVTIITSIFVCPVWAGNELHNLAQGNMEKLADSLEGYVAKYFGNDANANHSKSETCNNILAGYVRVLDSMATQESLANHARWEPAHGSFNFRHPWKDYLELGALLRSSACCIDSLSGIVSDTKAPDFSKQHFSSFCIKLSSASSALLRELVVVLRTLAKSPKIDLRLEEMCDAVQELENALRVLPDWKNGSTESETQSQDSSDGAISIIEMVQLVTLSSLLIEIAARTEKIVKVVNRLVDKGTTSENKV